MVLSRGYATIKILCPEIIIKWQEADYILDKKK
jgi:hypothetical protein